jgi:hypothetical protein
VLRDEAGGGVRAVLAGDVAHLAGPGSGRAADDES